MEVNNRALRAAVRAALLSADWRDGLARELNLAPVETVDHAPIVVWSVLQFALDQESGAVRDALAWLLEQGFARPLV